MTVRVGFLGGGFIANEHGEVVPASVSDMAVEATEWAS
jgi:hypothetical protein